MKTGRNDPCPCGSGKKYKKCCLSKSYPETGRENSIQKRLVQDLLNHFKKYYQNRLDDANLIFWDDFVPEEYLDDMGLDMAFINFWEWITYDYLIDEDNGKTLIDLYRENNRRLSSDECKLLSAMRNSFISLYEVQEVFPEQGLLLKDLLLGREYDVKEKLATRTARKWDIYAARLLYLDGKYIMSGSVYPYPIKEKERILTYLHEEYEACQQDCPGVTMEKFLKENGDIFNFFWYDLFQNPAPIILHTTTGEPMLFSEAIFEIKDKEAVLNGLPKIKGFEEDKDNFIWLGEGKNEESATVLGWVEIQESRLILRCNSKKRLEKGKKLILKALSEALIHKIDTFQDPLEAVKSYKEVSSQKPENEIPIEVQQELYTEFMHKHYVKWLREKLPALNGETPLRAVKTEEGRKQVIELLKMFENNEEHNKRDGRPHYDISWLWERLGLEKEG